MSNCSDQLYANSLTDILPFQFTPAVAEVFPDMLERSIPGYAEIVTTIGKFATKLVQPQSTIYDLGCSLGAVSVAIRRNVQDAGCQIIAVDNSQAMIDRATQAIGCFKSFLPVQLLCQNILDLSIENASLVVLNFTLQFIPAEARLALIQTIYQGLRPGGALIISEKITFADPTCRYLLDNLHVDFKRANGYSELEISQKRTALETVMQPDTLSTHFTRLKQGGFQEITTWYQQLNFASLIAIK